MPIIAVLCVLLLFIAALSQSFGWRVQPPVPGPWYASAAFVWGVFFLALYMEWPTLKGLGL